MKPQQAIEIVMNKTAENRQQTEMLRAKAWFVVLYFVDTDNVVAFDAVNPLRLLQYYIEKKQEIVLLEISPCQTVQIAQNLRQNFNSTVRAYCSYRNKVAADPDVQAFRAARKLRPAEPENSGDDSVEVPAEV